jgi:Flp pilus assembly pilin Flp
MNRVQPDRDSGAPRPQASVTRPATLMSERAKERVMKSMKNLMLKLWNDEQGGEVLEYALIAGLIVVAAIAVIGAVGTKVVARWTSLNSSM